MENSSRHNISVSVKTERVDFEDSCRVCMTRECSMKSIFDNEDNSIVERIRFCTEIEVSKGDGLPTKICVPCLQDLQTAHKFKTSLLLSEENFRKILVTKIKTESEVVRENLPEYLDDHIGDQDVMFDNNDDDTVEVKPNDDIMKMLRLNGKKRVRLRKVKPEKKTEKSLNTSKTNINGEKKQKRIYKAKFKRLACEVCNIKFETKEESDKHKKEMHTDSDNFICEVCGKFFLHRSSHYTHLKTHLPPQYACHHCDYSTWHKHDLAKHLRIHTGKKLYQCESCPTTYYTSSNLKSHIRRCHTKEKRFQCTICEKRFYDKTKLSRHIDSHNDIKRHECSVCHACFTRRCYWKKHLERHHGIVVPAVRPGRRKTYFLMNRELNGDTKDEVT